MSLPMSRSRRRTGLSDEMSWSVEISMPNQQSNAVRVAAADGQAAIIRICFLQLTITEDHSRKKSNKYAVTLVNGPTFLNCEMSLRTSGSPNLSMRWAQDHPTYLCEWTQGRDHPTYLSEWAQWWRERSDVLTVLTDTMDPWPAGEYIVIRGKSHTVIVTHAHLSVQNERDAVNAEWEWYVKAEWEW